MWRGLLILSITWLLLLGCASETREEQGIAVNEKALITFVELGSVRCVPCKKMQPVMTSIEARYGDQIQVVFYDVWEADQKHYAQQYGIKLIPTQVFLDSKGNEIMRHEGFFPEAEIDAFLVAQGLTASKMSTSL
jgi:thioredoxin 1